MSTEVKVDCEVIKNNRNKLSNIGGSFGGKFFRVHRYALNDKYGEIIANVRNENNKDICLNRGINRFKIDGFDIHSMSLKEAGDGTSCVFINEGDKDATGHDMSVVCPVGAVSNGLFLQPTEETIGKALNENDRNLIFSNPDSIVDIVNTYNRHEITRIDNLITMLQNARNSLTQTIENNTKRALDYKKELHADNGSAHVTVVGTASVDL